MTKNICEEFKQYGNVKPQPYLKLADDLVKKRDEVVQLLGVGILQQTLHGDWYKGHHLLLQTHHHAVQELSHPGVQDLSLHRCVQHLQEHLKCVGVYLHTAAVLHSLLPRETLTRPAVGKSGSNTYFVKCLFQKKEHVQGDR